MCRGATKVPECLDIKVEEVSLPVRHTHKAGHGHNHCQVLGCSSDLSLAKVYCQKKHLCPHHMQADAVQLEHGDSQQLYRFCFQCGKLQELQSFDGPRRTCRQGLQKRRCNNAAKQVAAAAVSTSVTAADKFCQQQQQQQQQVLDTMSYEGSTEQMDCIAQAASPPLSTAFSSFMSSTGVCGQQGASTAPLLGCNSNARLQLQSSNAPSSLSDMDCLQLTLESELAAAALQVALASPRPQLDPESQELSRMLANAIVEDSGLFDVDDVDDYASQQSPPLAQQGANLASSNTSSCTSNGDMSCDIAAALMQGCAAGAAWPSESSMGHSGTAGLLPPPHRSCAATTAAPVAPYPAASAVLPPAAPVVPRLPDTLFLTATDSCDLLHGKNVCCFMGHAERLQHLKQQMVQLQARVEALRGQLGM